MPDYRKLFFLVFVVGIAVRLFVALTLPDLVMTDTVYHLSIARQVIEMAGLSSIDNLPPALFHVYLASAAIITGIGITVETVKSFVLLALMVQLLTAFILLRKLFPRKWSYGMALFAILPLVTKFSAVSYIETIASVFVMVSFYFFVRFRETGYQKFLVLGIFTLAAMSVSKLNATILLPCFLAFFLLEARKKSVSKKAIAAFLIVAVLLSSTWFVADFLRTGQFFSSNQSDVANLLGYPARAASSNPLAVIGFFNEFNKGFWEFPSEQALSRSSVIVAIPIFQMFSAQAWHIIFSVLTIPMLLFLIFSIFWAVKKKQRYSGLLLSLFIFAFLVILGRGSKFVYARLFLPVMPLLSISFVQGFSLVSANWKKVIAALFIVLAAYSFLNVSFTALYYNNSFNKSLGLYERIAELPKESKVIISGNQSRILTWFSDVETLGPEGAFNMPRGTDANEIVPFFLKHDIYSKLKELSITHFALTCVDDPWNRETVAEMEGQGMITKIFEDDCSALFEVN